MPREDPSTSRIQRSLEEQNCRGHVRAEKSYRDFDGINGDPTEFEWNIFQECNSTVKVTDFLSRLGETPKNFTGRILFMSMFNDISCDKKDNEEECLANAKVVSILAKKFGIGQWSFIGAGSEKKWYSGEENSPQGALDHIVEEMLLEFAESGHPNLPCNDSIVQGSAQEQRTWKIVNTLRCR